jgi:copper chaperone CopZ
MVHGIADVVHELERVRAEQEKQTALLERLVAAVEERGAD